MWLCQIKLKYLSVIENVKFQFGLIKKGKIVVYDIKLNYITFKTSYIWFRPLPFLGTHFIMIGWEQASLSLIPGAIINS